VYGRLAGYEDVNDAGRLAHDPAMRAIVGREGIDRPAASTSQMGRFETEWLATEADLAALADRRPLTQGGKSARPVMPRRKRDRGGAAPEAVSRPPPRPAAHASADPGASHHSAATAYAVCARSQSVM
jgi:hypothetical protein